MSDFIKHLPAVAALLDALPVESESYAFAVLQSANLKPDVHAAARTALYRRAEVAGRTLRTGQTYAMAARLVDTISEADLADLNTSRRTVLQAAGATDDVVAALRFVSALRLISADDTAITR